MTDVSVVDAAITLPHLSDQFLLDPDTVFLNHGSFGACPKPVFEAYQRWQRELERDPVNFIQRRLQDLLAATRDKVAAYAGTTADRLVFVPNATYAINVVARSIELRPGDEVLGTNHEYGAVNNTWRYVCQKNGAHYVQAEIDLPVSDADSVVESIWSRVTDRTRVISVSHITAPTAMILPVRALCRRAREAGITTVIDGAHAPGQLELELDDLGADYYAGNAHKWLCAPKGAAILYSREGRDSLLEPLVVSHGWNTAHSDSRLQDNFGWTGTADPSSYLSISDAIDFQQTHNWAAVREACHSLASYARRAIQELTGLDPICPDSREWYSQMFTARLPQHLDHELRERLWEQFRIEVPVFRWNEQAMIRVSVQAYNSARDVDCLLAALETVIRE
jgi:isopenicillin-N epimerase